MFVTFLSIISNRLKYFMSIRKILQSKRWYIVEVQNAFNAIKQHEKLQERWRTKTLCGVNIQTDDLSGVIVAVDMLTQNNYVSCKMLPSIVKVLSVSTNPFTDLIKLLPDTAGFGYTVDNDDELTVNDKTRINTEITRILINAILEEGV